MGEAAVADELTTWPGISRTAFADAMIYIKSVLVGFVVAVVAVLLYIFEEMNFLLPRWGIAQTGSGGIGAVSSISYGPFVGIAAFALGFYIMFRRFKSRRSAR